MRIAGLLTSEIAEWPPVLQRSRAAAFDRAATFSYRGLNHYATGANAAALAEYAEADRRPPRSRLHRPTIRRS